VTPGDAVRENPTKSQLRHDPVIVGAAVAFTALAAWLLLRTSDDQETQPAAAPPPPPPPHRPARTPDQWARDKISRMTTWWNAPFGAALRAFTPLVMSGLPAQAIMGFCGNGEGVTHDTVESGRSALHEYGPMGTEGGPASATNDPTPGSRYGVFARDPVTVALLGHPADTTHDAWKTKPDEQAAVGLVSLRRHGRDTSRALGALGARSEGSVWFFALLCMGWSAGDGRAAHEVNAFAPRLRGVPERDRFAALAQAVVDAQASGTAFDYDNPSWTVLRTAQKIEGGRLLAARTGGDPDWFGPRLSLATQTELVRLGEAREQ
jgi:hypothetical protein